MEQLLSSDPIVLFVLLAAGAGVVYISRIFIASRDMNDEKNRQAYQEMVDKILANNKEIMQMVLEQQERDNATLRQFGESFTSMNGKLDTVHNSVSDVLRVMTINNNRLSQIILHLGDMDNKDV